MEYTSAIKKNEILPFATTWMELEGIMLSETSQSEKDRYHMSKNSYVALEKLNRRPWRKVRGETITNREGGRQTIRLLNTENKLRKDGVVREREMGGGH